MALVGSLSASRISSELTTTVLGMPATMSRPLTSIVSCCSSGYALPMVILMRSAVCSPMAMLYLRFMYAWIASSILSPPTRTLCE